MLINKTEINAIILDLGGVILDIDVAGVFEQFRRLKIGPNQEALEVIKHNDIFNRFERGEFTPEEFRNEIRKISQNAFSNKEFDAIWNSMLICYPKENIKILEKLQSKYRTFLMSNTNEIHYVSYTNMLCNEFAYQTLDQLFENAYYSHTSGMRKPDTEFFLHILKENKLKAGSTLFVDDSIENIEAANSVGIKTLHLKEGKKLSDFF